MLETIIVVLLLLWLFGHFTLHLNGLIHLLAVLALIVIVVRLVQGRRVL